MNTEIIAPEVYSPTAVLALLNNALRLPGTESLIYLRGRYALGNGKAYINYYYDTLYAEGDSTMITLKIPALLRTKITNNKIYTLRGFVEKTLRGSRIDINFVVDGIVSQEQSSFSEEDLKKYELIQKKLELGSKDLENLIRTKILNGEKIKIVNIYGHNAIVQKDFKEGLDVSEQYFDIVDDECNITSSTSIISKLTQLSSRNFDVIALVRGGGDKQSFEVFNDLNLAEIFIGLSAISVTAIGHTVNESLLDKLADRKFHLPFDYGAGLHFYVDKLVQERSNSRAVLIEEVKKDVTKQFDEQVKTLTAQLTKKNDEFVEAQKTFKEQVENQTKTFNEQLKVRNDEVEKLKKDLSEKHGEQVKTLSEQLTKKNDEFQKLQENNAKELENIHKNYQTQQAARLKEIEDSKKEIAELHEKNLQSAVNEKTAQLAAKLSTVEKELESTKNEKNKQNINWGVIVLALILGLVLGFIFFRLL